MCIAIKHNGWHIQRHVRQRILLSVMGMSLSDESEIVAQEVSVACYAVSHLASHLHKGCLLLSITVNMTSFHALVG